MALSEALKQEQDKANSPLNRCPINRLYGTLSESDIETLNTALQDIGFQHAAISRALNAEGHDVSQEAVSRHRRGICSCR
jgi:hypothetical protein